MKLENYQFALDVSLFDVAKVEDMSYMFSYTFYRHPGIPMVAPEPAINGDLKLFNYTKPAFSLFAGDVVLCKAEHIFDGCGVPEIDLRDTDFFNATDLSYAFAHLGFEEKQCHIIGLPELQIGQNEVGCKLVSLFDSSYLYFDDQVPGRDDIALDLTG